MVQESLDSCGMGFMFAPVFHPSMRNVIGPRRELGLRTFFNILGPMTNPAGVRNQLIGVCDPSLGLTMARVLRDLGAEQVLVVNGSGMDECTTTGSTHVLDLRYGRIAEYEIEPSSFGIDVAEPEAIRGGDAMENARIALSVLKGVRSPRSEIVALNAAAGLYVSGKAETIHEGLEMARSALSSGRAYQKLKRFSQVSWALEERRQRESSAASVFDRRVHPNLLMQRADELCKHLVNEMSTSEAGRQMLQSLDSGLLAHPSVLTVITLRRAMTLMAGIRTKLPPAGRAGRSLSDSLASSRGVALIAEYKLRSPTSQPPSVSPDPILIADEYSSGGVSGVSVVVEPEFFGGSLELFSAIRARLNLPMLFKDFTVSDVQIDDACRLGADAVLLIAKALRPETLDGLIRRCLSKGVEPVVEIHDVADLEKLRRTPTFDSVRMVGINSRDLRTLQTDLSGLSALREATGGDKLVIAESGVTSADDVAKLTGFDAVLVGTAFMRAEDPAAKVRELVSACQEVAR
jgi:indole-3-glycerol phosphate synthase